MCYHNYNCFRFKSLGTEGGKISIIAWCRVADGRKEDVTLSLSLSFFSGDAHLSTFHLPLDDDLIAGAYVVAVQHLVRVLHLLQPLQIAKVLIDVVQPHPGGRHIEQPLQPGLQIAYRALKKEKGNGPLS